MACIISKLKICSQTRIRPHDLPHVKCQLYNWATFVHDSRCKESIRWLMNQWLWWKDDASQFNWLLYNRLRNYHQKSHRKSVNKPIKTTLNACYHSENIDDIIVLSLSIQQGTESQQSCCSDPADHCDLKVLFIQHFLNWHSSLASSTAFPV